MGTIITRSIAKQVAPLLISRLIGRNQVRNNLPVWVGQDSDLWAAVAVHLESLVPMTIGLDNRCEGPNGYRRGPFPSISGYLLRLDWCGPRRREFCLPNVEQDHEDCIHSTKHRLIRV